MLARSFAAAVLAMLAASSASAMTVSFSQVLDQAYIDSLHGATIDSLAPTSITGTVAERVGSVDGQWRSPYEFTSYAGTESYFSIQRNSSATFVLDGLAKSLSFIWGSPDSYNLAVFGTDGSSEAMTGDISSLYPQGTPGRGAVRVTLTAHTAFSSFVFSSGNNAFEYDGLEVAAVPVPAAGLLLASVLAGLVAYSRRRRAA